MKRSPRPPIRRVGLTGGIGAGKSAVAELLREAGVFVVNLDDLGRKITEEDPKIIARINEACGILGSTFDRQRVREVIFSKPEVRTAIEGWLHPIILKGFEAEVEAAATEGRRILVCEAALLVEGNYHKDLDDLIVVTAPVALRKQRLIERDAVSPEIADKMIASQMPEEAKRNLATVVIENEGDLDTLEENVEELLETWRADGLLDKLH